jgi:energy-coupling factor transporter ATP-binding protein EcfA2
MKIRQVALENFKSFGDFSVGLRDFDVLVGINNSGKSTILQAIYVAHHFLTECCEFKRTRNRCEFVPRAFREFPFFPLPKPSALWKGNRTFQTPVRIGITYTDGSRFTFQVTLQYGAFAVRISEAPPNLTTEYMADLIAHPPAYVPSFAGAVVREPFFTAKRRGSLMAEGHYAEILRNLILVVRDRDPYRFTRMEYLLGSHFGISKLGTLFDPEKDDYIRADYLEGRTRHDLVSGGSGFLQLVQILAYIYLSDPSTVLLDEPDAHLHPAMQRRLINLLRDLSATEGLQVVMATHSKEIINNVAPDVIVSVSNEEQHGIRLSTYGDVLAVLEDIGSVDNVDAATLLRSKRAVFVEGDEDRLLSVFARTLDISAFEGPKLTVVISLKGAENVSRVSEIRTFEDLIGTDLKAFVIRDRDYIPPEADAAFAEEARRHGVMSHIWSRTMVENYLLVPTALHRVISQAIDQRNAASDEEQQPPTVEEVTALLDTAAEATRTETLARLTGAIEKGDRGLATETAVRKASEILEGLWTDLDSKLVICHGKETLARFRRVCSERYRVSFTNRGIAEAMERGEIDQEIADVLAAIADL